MLEQLATATQQLAEQKREIDINRHTVAEKHAKIC